MNKPLRNTTRNKPAPCWIPAITTKEIRGTAIKTIPIGTYFCVSYIHKEWSISDAEFFGISQIWNDEYELIESIDKNKCSD